MKTQNGYELELVVNTRAEDINGGLGVYLSKNGKPLNRLADVGRCAQVTFSGVGFEVYTESVLYTVYGTSAGEKEKFLEKTVKWLRHIQ